MGVDSYKVAWQYILSSKTSALKNYNSRLQVC